MMLERKNQQRSPHQDDQRHFRNAQLIISGVMLLGELLLLVVLFWRQPSFLQTPMFFLLFLLVSGAVLLPLFLGFLVYSARVSSLFLEKVEDQQNTEDFLQ